MFLVFSSSNILLYVGLWAVAMATLLLSGDYLWQFFRKAISDAAVFFKAMAVNACQFIQRLVVVS